MAVETKQGTEMLARIGTYPKRAGWLVSLCVLLPAASAAQAQQAQTESAERALVSFSIASTGVADESGTLIKVARTAETRDLRNGSIEDTLNYSLGLSASPLEGLDLDTNIWRSEFDALSLGNTVPAPILRSGGFDVGAAYAWDTNRFGQFTLSARTSYTQDFYDTEGLLAPVNGNLSPAKPTSPKLRGNLKLSWDFGNHSASAVTRYFDAPRDLSELGMDEINDLVDDITTVDLEYGYNIAARSGDRAVISFGIQNVFDRKTMQILNSATRILDQNGRVAYGRLKYQF